MCQLLPNNAGRGNLHVRYVDSEAHDQPVHPYNRFGELHYQLMCEMWSPWLISRQCNYLKRLPWCRDLSGTTTVRSIVRNTFSRRVVKIGQVVDYSKISDELEVQSKVLSWYGPPWRPIIKIHFSHIVLDTKCIRHVQPLEKVVFA